MLNETDVYATHSDADLPIGETMNLKELTISENPSTPNLCKNISSEVGAVNCSLSEAACLEEVVEELSLKTTEENFEKLDCDENPSISISGDSNTYTQEHFPFPPVKYRKDGNELIGPLKLFEYPNQNSADYDSDDTCDDYVECGEQGLCKCRRMRGREYYEYYAKTKDINDYYRLYSQGRCTLPKGTILHFIGAPNNMKREDAVDALVALGAKVEFLDYQRGSKEGWARLSFPHEARIIIKKMIDKKLNILGADLSFRVLSGKDEKSYHKKVIEDIYKLQEKAKGLNTKLRKAGYKYVSK